MFKFQLYVKRALLSSVLFFIFSCSTNSFEKAELEEKIKFQEKCWNNNDIEGFMQTYWNSDSLKFIGKSGLKLGWNTTLKNYEKSYPSKEAMGKLQFDIHSTEQLGNNFALMIGKWNLYRNTDTLSGYSTIIWRKINEEWLIIADHSS